MDPPMPFAVDGAGSAINAEFQDQVDHQQALQLSYQNNSELMSQNDMIPLINNQNLSFQNNLMHSAQPVDQRIMDQKNIRPS